jgi:hypothetical protein
VEQIQASKSAVIKCTVPLDKQLSKKQRFIDKMSSYVKAKKSDLQRQLNSATAKYEETGRHRDLAESKLKDLECLNEDLDL